jgi:hypothetical protein
MRGRSIRFRKLDHVARCRPIRVLVVSELQIRGLLQNLFVVEGELGHDCGLLLLGRAGRRPANLGAFIFIVDVHNLRVTFLALFKKTLDLAGRDAPVLLHVLEEETRCHLHKL